MQASEWLQVITLGAIVGAAGQAARIIVGLKKLNDAAAQNNQAVALSLDPSRLVISLVIGAVAGILGTLTMDVNLSGTISATTLGTLIAVGYAGTDFIEGFMTKAQVQAGAPVSASAPGVTASLPATPLVVTPLSNAPVIKLPN